MVYWIVNEQITDIPSNKNENAKNYMRQNESGVIRMKLKHQRCRRLPERKCRTLRVQVQSSLSLYVMCMFEERKPFNLYPITPVSFSLAKWIDRGSSNAIHKNVCNENEGNKNNSTTNERTLREINRIHTKMLYSVFDMNAKTT